MEKSVLMVVFHLESVDTPIFWMRFIDNVFFIWTHGEEKLDLFTDFLNSSHDTIKFTGEHSTKVISFLDVQVSVGEGESLRQICFANQLMLISICTKNLVTPGILRR